MKSYRMTIAGLERALPICPLNDKLSIGAFVIFGDPELTVACARDLLKLAPEYDYIITAESKGIPWFTRWRVKAVTRPICWLARLPSFT